MPQSQRDVTLEATANGRRPEPFEPAQRVYAVGDVHGRLDLFERLIELIRVDSAARPAVSTRLILLGDVIDRGPQSAELVRRLIRYTRATDKIVVLKGNHEAMMVEALLGDRRALPAWLAHGGDATLLSWGTPPAVLQGRSLTAIRRLARQVVSEDELAWLDNLPLAYRWGGYLFVHAGIRPGVALEDQAPEDLLWIGDEFLNSTAQHPAVIVHGHSIRHGSAEVLPNRIGIDTGAYSSGRLTCLGLEGSQSWTLST